MAELIRAGGHLGSERVRLVLSSENNWPVPAPIHQSDSTWPRGNEWINKGERMQCVDEVEPAGQTLSERTVTMYTVQPLLAQWHYWERSLHIIPTSQETIHYKQMISDSESGQLHFTVLFSLHIYWHTLSFLGPVMAALLPLSEINRTIWPLTSKNSGIETSFSWLWL